MRALIAAVILSVSAIANAQQPVWQQLQELGRATSEARRRGEEFDWNAYNAQQQRQEEQRQLIQQQQQLIQQQRQLLEQQAAQPYAPPAYNCFLNRGQVYCLPR